MQSPNEIIDWGSNHQCLQKPLGILYNECIRPNIPKPSDPFFSQHLIIKTFKNFEEFYSDYLDVHHLDSVISLLLYLLYHIFIYISICLSILFLVNFRVNANISMSLFSCPVMSDALTHFRESKKECSYMFPYIFQLILFFFFSLFWLFFFFGCIVWLVES